MNTRLMRWDLRLKTIFTLLMLLLGTMLVWAADAPQPPEGGTLTATSWQAVLVALIPVLVPVIIAVIKLALTFWGSKIPKVLPPLLAPVLGALLDLIINQHLGTGTVWGAVLGSAGVGLREIVDQLRNLGATPTA
jgi:hypothetical protein